MKGFTGIASFALAVIIVVVNWSIWKKEQHIAEGSVVYLALAPVDPRSLMQGDYMALRFDVGSKVESAISGATASPDGAPRREFVVVSLDEHRVGTFARLDDDTELSESEVRLRYRARGGDVKFATNAFFFQEGEAKAFERARFGRFRVDAHGELLLVSMHDERLEKIGAR
ncbi:MAG: GDYXXLXY domain-containing protein [Pseudomonadota bacterium]